jgi:hypothetical protein
MTQAKLILKASVMPQAITEWIASELPVNGLLVNRPLSRMKK